MRLYLGAVMAMLAVAVTGCGSSSATGSSNAPSGVSGTTETAETTAVATPAAVAAGQPDRVGLEAAVRAYSQAYLGGQGSVAYGLLSRRCQFRVGAAEMDGLTAAARAQYGPQPITTLTVDTFAGTLARVSYVYPDAAINQREEPWAFENGAWHQDDC
ncbi:hypothetical protein AB1484_33025 [Parafrankia sp. FMc6]|uniref:hypothetical protein n=1 Tax=Parafrankia soli TaxID=2599596 RepID=UPI0034D6F469